MQCLIANLMNERYVFSKEDKNAIMLLVSITSESLKITINYELGIREVLLCFCYLSCLSKVVIFFSHRVYYLNVNCYKCYLLFEFEC